MLKYMPNWRVITLEVLSRTDLHFKWLRMPKVQVNLLKIKLFLDSTSGNTGIAYAWIGALKGYKVELVMPMNVSEERKRIVRAFGAKITFSDPLEGSDGAILESRKLLKENPGKYFKPDQYNNSANSKAHYLTTGKEIFEQTEGRVTHFIATIGTGGTIMGQEKGSRNLT